MLIRSGVIPAGRRYSWWPGPQPYQYYSITKNSVYGMKFVVFHHIIKIGLGLNLIISVRNSLQTSGLVWCADFLSWTICKCMLLSDLLISVTFSFHSIIVWYVLLFYRSGLKAQDGVRSYMYPDPRIARNISCLSFYVHILLEH